MLGFCLWSIYLKHITLFVLYFNGKYSALPNAVPFVWTLPLSQLTKSCSFLLVLKCLGVVWRGLARGN